MACKMGRKKSGKKRNGKFLCKKRRGGKKRGGRGRSKKMKFFGLTVRPMFLYAGAAAGAYYLYNKSQVA